MAKEQGQEAVRERQRVDLRKPRRYKVILLNDDFTTMEFVVEVLVSVFHKSEPEAEALMMKVHQEGRAVVGIYSLDIASTKTNEVRRMADEAGFPLRATCEPE